MSSWKLLLTLLFLYTLIESTNSFTLITTSNETNPLTNVFIEEGRKKKLRRKFLLPILFGALMVKAVIFPLAFKTMAVMTSIAVLISTFSLIMSSIVGYVKVAARRGHPSIRVDRYNEYPSLSKDEFDTEYVEYDPNIPSSLLYHT